MQGKSSTIVKRTVDVCMTVLMLCLMAYQVTGEKYHEWIGIGMTLLVIVHQILNRKWYKASFKGKYNAYRILTLVIDVSLLSVFALTAFCGISMSSHAVPFLYGMTKLSFARRMHLSMSFWAFAGAQAAILCKIFQSKKENRKNPLLPVVFIIAAIIIGGGLHMALKG